MKRSATLTLTPCHVALEGIWGASSAIAGFEMDRDRCPLGMGGVTRRGHDVMMSVVTSDSLARWTTRSQRRHLAEIVGPASGLAGRPTNSG